MAQNSPLCFTSRDEWRRWLEMNHAVALEVWLVHYRKGSKQKGLTYPDAVEEALCFGWIDSKLKSMDADRFMLRYSPRNPRSVWSQGNRDTAQALIDSGKMTPSGLATVEAAKRNGRWESAYSDRESLPVPDDLRAALASVPGALSRFHRLPVSHRNQYVRWIDQAKRTVTRERRISEAVQKVRNTDG